MNHNVALLVIDVQVGMFEEDQPVYEGNQLLKNLETLIAQARSKHLPVLYVQHNEHEGPLTPGSRQWQVHPAIAPQDGDVIIQKWTPDSFHKTNLHDELQKAGIHKLVLCGMQTEFCVDTTCRRAFSMGYEVVLVKDAHSTYNTNRLTAEQIIGHHNDVLRWFADMKDTVDVEF